MNNVMVDLAYEMLSAMFDRVIEIVGPIFVEMIDNLSYFWSRCIKVL